MTDKQDGLQSDQIDTEMADSQQPQVVVDYGEAELEVLAKYLVATCHSLLDLNKDLLNKELHTETVQKRLKTFAEEKQSRALVVTKLEKGSVVKEGESMKSGETNDISSALNSEINTGSPIEIYFSDKVEYFGNAAQTIAFLKREDFSVLNLKADLDLDKLLDQTVNSQTQPTSVDFNEERVDLSTQLQLVNLGYIGQDSNIFELASTYVDFSFLPLFQDFKSKSPNSGAASVDPNQSGASGLDTIIKELSSLKMHLAQCRQNLDIPMVELGVDNEVKKRVEAGRKAKQPCKVNDFEDIKDDSFKQRLQGNINNWLKDIRKVSQLEHQIQNGTALQEANFWAQMERSLTFVKDQLNSEEVLMVFAILSQTNQLIKFRFDSDIEIDNKLKQAKDYNKCLKEVPLKLLNESTTIEQIAQAVKKIFGALKRVSKVHNYPAPRTIELSACVARDFDEQLKKIIGQQNLLQIEYQKYRVLQKEFGALQKAWQEAIADFKSGLQSKLTGAATTGGKSIDERIKQIADDPLFKRLNAVTDFRQEHYQLVEVIEATLTKDSDKSKNNYRDIATADMQEAYEVFCKTVQVLEITKEGRELWDAAKRQYDVQTAKVEQQLTQLLKQKLERAGSANEMFQVFSVYNKLFMRPKIRGAITQYQSQLLTQVREDVDKLKVKLLDESKNDETLNHVRDFPMVVNKIIWINQLEQKLKFYQQRVKEVLGEDWEAQQEGQDLKKLCDNLENRLKKNQKEYFDKWNQEITALDIESELQKPIFKIEQRGNKFNLVLNCDENIFRLSKEKALIEKAIMHFDLPFRMNMPVKFKADQVEQTYPTAMSLQQSLRTFQVTNSKMNDSFTMLVAAKKNEAQTVLLQGLDINFKNAGGVKTLASKILQKVIIFEEAVDEVMEKTQFVDQLLSEIRECETEKITERLKEIQKIINDFDLGDFSNLAQWVAELNVKIEGILVRRLEDLLQQWTEEFQEFQTKGGNMIRGKMVLDIKLQSFTIILEPTLAEARAYWYKQLHNQVEVICGLERVDTTKSNLTASEKSYKNLLLKMGEKFNIRQAYDALEKVFGDAITYFDTWKSYQALWDIDLEKVFSQLGDNIDNWNQLLKQIRQGRKIFDSNEDFKCFGGLEITYSNVASKVSNKYDQLHKEILSKFGSTLAVQMRDFKSKIQEARRKLESLSLEDSDDVTLFVTEIQEMKRIVVTWEDQLERCKAGQKLLQEQRYTWPSDWLSIDLIEGEWASFKQILNKRSTTMEEQIPLLQAKILKEEENVQAKIKEIEHEWKENRPKEASTRPEIATSQIKKATNQLQILGQKIKQTQEELVRVCKAKELLNMELGDSHYLDSLQEDHLNLLQLWQHVGEVWQAIEKVDQTPFQVYVHKTVKDVIDAKQNEMRDFPNKMRSYQIYDAYIEQLKNYKKVNDILMDLRNDAMKPKHWKELLSKLKITTKFSDIILNELWCADLLGKSKAVNDVLTQSRGEAILENFLNQIKEMWSVQEVELVKYQNKCKLIKGWDDLFALVDDHMNNISSMKMSPYYKVFEKDIEPWSKTLEQIRVIFDFWLDVQRRYVYLEGIFFGSADIKSMLSNEFTKFKNIDSDFVRLMKQVNKEPKVLEILKIANLEKTLQNFTTQLEHIKKALNEYLEKQRQNFARFYFVGDEDLLEIIGNSKEIKNIQRHFPKMFAGITTVNSEKGSDDGDIIVGMNSREGESVPFNNKVNINEDPTIYKWLTKIEESMQTSLAFELSKAVTSLEILDRLEQQEEFNAWITRFAAQIVILSLQVSWSNRVEDSLNSKQGKSLPATENNIKVTLEMLAERVLLDLPGEIRKKYEQLITDLVHQREVTRQLINSGIQHVSEFTWLYHMRFYWNNHEKSPLEKLGIRMANGYFFYGFEYLGVSEKLVQTPLTDKCYLTLTQALHWRMGGSPFGPAGTGKTESVKALGAQLGKFVLVFNCDETFDGNAMGRIFVGLCQVGAWGCFDEFNRLEERMLSAVSQQILQIQMGLREQAKRIDLMGRDIKLNQQMGIFITMNPGYAGRSNLPDNLKQLFRQMAMTRPDKEMIARVMLYSQGFKTAERLSGKIVSLFELCHNQLSSQSHYDFGLRALKSVLVSSGNLKRAEKMKVKDQSEIDEKWEQNILIKSLCDTLVPKLIQDDIPLLSSLLTGVFPGSSIIQNREGQLKENLIKYASQYNLIAETNFIEKCMQLFQIQFLHHGVMMVGPTGVGKTAAWRLLLMCMELVDKVKGESYVVDPKSISKDDLYGKLDSTTAEWTDGVFTGILRKIIDNARGEMTKRHWIIFDGDVDPEWAENLNSVLDDNKLLTLPSGERLSIPPNVRIMFEVETLKHATLATVSRCGMVWFSEETITSQMMYQHYLARLQQDDFDSKGEAPEEDKVTGENQSQQKTEQQQMKQLSEGTIKNRAVRRACVEAIKHMFIAEDDYSFATRALESASNMIHVMQFTRMRALEAFFSLIRKGIENIIEFNESSDFPLEGNQITGFMQKWVIFAACWGIGGSMNLQTRTQFSNKLADFTDVETPSISGGVGLIDYEIRLADQKWHLWKEQVPQIDIEPRQVTDADVVINTVDTTRHQEVLCSWLSEKRPFLLCGPPGSGKTMTLMATLKKLTDMEMVFINFSSSTTPALVLKTFEHYCEIKKTNTGLLMTPLQANKWLVVFCDEINLPEADKYGTQTVITFLRQITEQNGFWRSSDKQWVQLERIMFVGACNPPTDSGRVVLSDRFLRHAPLIFVDFPGPDSLKQIYGTFNRAMLKKKPHLKSYGDPLTEAMVDFYTQSQQHFTADMQPHYIYSPRELTRWKYAIFEALEPLEEPEDLARLYVHEGLRLFEDRLVYQHEKEWCNTTIDACVRRWFSGINIQKAIERPIYFTTYLHRNYVSVGQEELKEYIEARLKQFQEEVLDVPLVVFDSVLDHILRIDRVLRQPLGHLLLVGASGVGKTTLTKFVSWINDLEVFQIKAGRNYSVYDFDEDLRKVMRQAGVEKKKICFIFDESNVLGAAFLERMNALLAGGEVPGLFDGEDYTKLIAACKEEARKNNKMLDTEEEIYKQFTKDVQRNLHVAFTMNPANADFSNRSASSPALFNRCVIDWFGDWADDGLLQVAKEFTKYLDIQSSSFTKNVDMGGQMIKAEPGQKRSDPKHELLCQCIVDMHISVRDLNQKLSKSAKKFNFITPRDFLNFIKQFITLQAEKKGELEELQSHLQVGITKLKNTEQSVAELSNKLKSYDIELKNKKDQVNKKMTMLTDQSQKVNQKKELAEKQKAQIEIKQVQISERQVAVERDLGKAEPALIAAQGAVQGVSSDNINEIRSFAKPPEKVRIALEPVIALILQMTTIPDWKTIQAELKKPTFKNSVLEFNKDKIQLKVKKFIFDTFLKNEADYDIDKFYNASKAAGPLAKWLKSIIEYAEIFDQIAPLRKEVDDLQQEQNQMAIGLQNVVAEIEQLQLNFDQMQQEFQVLVTDLTKLEEEQKSVKKKVDRSDALFKNLSSELIRWQKSSLSFTDNMASLMGDVLLSSAVLTYIGFFDHFQRQNLQVDWRASVEQINLKLSPALSFIEFLSKPQERLLWQSQELPNDDLCITNAIIMKRFVRYPLVIDPSDQALKYVMNHYKQAKIQKTSFNDNDFLARISEGLQYGVPVLVQDVEKIDPIMNTVLNKEVQKVGGRLVMQVGDKEIACNGELTLFMFTRDANAFFTPDLCSRVTFVNFTVTPSSLMSQCLNIYLKNEREEIDKKRNDLLKLQGEFKEKLRGFEEQLLDSLNKAEGEILENDALIQTLETLKKQAAIIAVEVAKTDETLEEIELVSNEYAPLSTMTTRIFFTLESMSSVHYLYQFSLQQFMDCVFEVLKNNEELKAVPKTQPQNRLKVIIKQLYIYINQTIGQGLLQEHQLLFTIRLAQIKLSEEPRLEELFDIFLKPASVLEPQSLPVGLCDNLLSKTQIAQIEELSNNSQFAGLGENMLSNEDKWTQMLNTALAEQELPEPWINGSDIASTNEVARALKKLIVIRVLRPDRLFAAANQFVSKALGDEIVNINQVDLMEFAGAKISPKNPIMLVSAPGFDASYRVENLAKQVNKKYVAVAIGSPEAFGLVDTAIRNAAKSGSWVLLKNVHLAPAWLAELEKKIYNMQLDANFRLFMTMENNPKVPSTLLRASHVLVFEPPSGIKAALQRSYQQTITQERTDREPVERKRLHFLVSWFNAVVQERLRYTPIGWSKVYEFNESDQRCTLDCIDEWIDSMGKNRSNVDPDKIPWDALRTLISQSVFGGKIDNDFDQKILQSLVDQFFRTESFNTNFELFQAAVGSDEQVLQVPDQCKSHKDFQKWIREISFTETPAWSGLPNNVEKIVRQRQATKLIANIKLIQGTGDDLSVNESDQSGANWLSVLQKRLEKMIDKLPGQLDLLKRTAQSITNPLFRFLEREVTVGSQLLDQVRNDMNMVLEMCKGIRKSSNILKQIAEDLHADRIPKQWRKYVIANISVTAWVSDFIKRIEQLKVLSASKDFGQSGLWFGGLLFPEAYLTATRQAVAQANKWSLEDVQLKFEIDLKPEQIQQNTQGFILTGFSMQGAEYDRENERVKLTEQISSTLPNVNFKWEHVDEIKKETQLDTIQIPVYLNKQRTNLLTAVNIPTYGVAPYIWYQRGVALFAWNNE